MGKPRVMTIHPGQSHSTADCYTALCAGLRMNGCEVIPFAWDQMLRPLNALTRAAIKGGDFDDAQAQSLHQFAAFVASADAIGVAVDSDVDAVIVVNGLLFPPSRVSVLRKLGIPVACFGTEAPYFLKDEQAIAPFYSHWFTNERSCVSSFGPHAFYLPHAYNPERHVMMGACEETRADVVFVGGGFPERKRLLAGVNWRGVTHAIHGTLWGVDLEQEIGATDFARNERWTEGVVPNEVTSAWHRSSKIALNMHRRMGHVETGDTIDHACYSLGPRAYEIPACGGFMLCDDERPEIFDVLGDSAATYAAWDSASLSRAIHYWLDHPDERERVQRAQHEAIQPHHWGARARAVLETIFA